MRQIRRPTAWLIARTESVTMALAFARYYDILTIFSFVKYIWVSWIYYRFSSKEPLVLTPAWAITLLSPVSSSWLQPLLSFSCLSAFMPNTLVSRRPHSSEPVALLIRNSSTYWYSSLRFFEDFILLTRYSTYLVLFLKTILIDNFCYSRLQASTDQWSSSLLSAYYPVLLTGASLIVCFWAEVRKWNKISNLESQLRSFWALK